MDSKSILTFQKNRILKIIDNFIEEYLLLCKTDNERIFFNSILCHLFDGRFSFVFDPSKGYESFCFDDFFPLKKWKSELTFEEKKSNYYPQYFDEVSALEGIELERIIENVTERILYKNRYRVYPNFKVEFDSILFNLDFAILYDVLEIEKIVSSKKIAIFCTNVKLHLDEEETNRETILKNKGWVIYKLTDYDIRNLINVDQLKNLFKSFSN